MNNTMKNRRMILVMILLCVVISAACSNKKVIDTAQQNTVIDIPESTEDGELSEDMINSFNEVFASVVNDNEGNTSPSEISCFFTSFYNDPRDIDLPEFLRYCPMGEVIDDEEEYQEVRAAASFDMPDTLDEIPTPVKRFNRTNVDDLLYKYTGITTAEMTGKSKGRAEMVYVESTDSFYNFTSDFAPGSFIAISGIKDNNTYTFLDSQNRKLIIELKNSKIQIKSFRLN